MVTTPTHTDHPARAEGTAPPPSPATGPPADSATPDLVVQARDVLRRQVRKLTTVATTGTVLLLAAAVARGLRADGPAGAAFWFGLLVLSYATDLPSRYRALRLIDRPPVQALMVGPEQGEPWLFFPSAGVAPLHFTGSPPGGRDPLGLGTVQSVSVFARELSPGQRALTLGPDMPRITVGLLRSGAGSTSPSGAVAEGWFPDPWHRAPVRWWDGQQWTHRTIPSEAAVADGREAAPASDATDPASPSGLSGCLEGRQWLTAAICCALLALFVVVAMVAVAAGNRGGIHPPEVAGELVLTLLVVLLVAAAARARRTRTLEWDQSGLVVHNFWRDRAVGWSDITDVDLTVRSGEGVTCFTPTLRLGAGRPCRA
jgi:hypothetical protein